ncbi:MAG: OmpA family protein [Gemmatimonadaceae bacterium]|nr:OmpA family protein [Gemmatimonadaceae bacterium]
MDKENEAIDGATSGKSTEDTARATAAPTEPGSTAPANASAGASAGATASAAPADKKVWANYDFIPGQRTIFFTDFSEDQVGNFPQRLEFKTGAMEVVEFEGGQRALRASSQGDFVIPLPEVLPDRFTIELDVTGRAGLGVGAETIKLAGGRKSGDNKFSEVAWGHGGFYLLGGPVQINLDTKDRERYLGKPASFRLLGDGKYLKAYVDERRLANVPNAAFQRDKALFIRLEGRDDDKDAVYLTRIRVAESQKTIYDELNAKGRWATQGILFDTGKSNIKPESTPTLKQIATTLKEHPDLKIEIQGHTDNVGKADANLKLSQARAEAVKRVLAAEYGVKADQLTAKGYGDTKPSGANKTPEGRANNRRVELVKS